jgi:predicted oxidoreductase
LRTGETTEFPSQAVIVATGGFQSNIPLALANWPAGLPKPPVLLAGSGVNSMGSGLKLAADAGAALTRLDHQWNYERGLPDPRYPGMNRGLNAAVQGLRVNAMGEILEGGAQSSDESLRLVLNEPGATFWTLFDEKQKRTFWISGSDWANFQTIQRKILDNPSIVKKASTLAELAAKTGLPAESLARSVAKHNAHGEAIKTPPFYAAQFYPMTRKSMGGIAIDLNARVLDRNSQPLRGLYAAGEATGEAGINGQRALEGTFLGPAVLTGRIAARTALADFQLPSASDRTAVQTQKAAIADSAKFDAVSCAACHPLATLINAPRNGYWHFERVHEAVLNSHRECVLCHAGIGEPRTPQHRIDPLFQAEKCEICHQSQ